MNRPAHAWLDRVADWLTPGRIRAQAMVLVVCLGLAAIADFATYGLLDQAGNIKFQDFAVFYISGKLVSQHRTNELFNPGTRQHELTVLLGHPAQVQLPMVYGPQVALCFAPLSQIPFLPAASLWVAASITIYLACSYWVWRTCPGLLSAKKTIALTVLAYPPLFHFAVRGQLSAIALLCFAAGFFAFRSTNDWLAGMALGMLIFKPSFLVGIVLIFFATGAWKVLSGVLGVALAQFATAWAYFGSAVMRSYFNLLWQLPQVSTQLEPGFSNAQMHSLRSFWALLIPWPKAQLVFYILSAAAALFFGAKVWRSNHPLSLRFSALVLVSVLLNAHLFVYDLLVLTPAFLLLADWTIRNVEHPWSLGIRALIYFSSLLPLFGPLAIWTRVQLSVLAFSALLVALGLIGRNQSAGAIAAIEGKEN